MIFEISKSGYDMYTSGLERGKQDLQKGNIQGAKNHLDQLDISDGTDQSKWFAIGYFDGSTQRDCSNDNYSIEMEF